MRANPASIWRPTWPAGSVMNLADSSDSSVSNRKRSASSRRARRRLTRCTRSPAMRALCKTNTVTPATTYHVSAVNT